MTAPTRRPQGVRQRYIVRVTLAYAVFALAWIFLSDRLLGPFDRRLQRYTKRALARLGVDVRLNTAVKEVFLDGSVTSLFGGRA